MADTMQSYAELLHERDRADFFGTVPNYKDNLQIEIDRVEAAFPAWVDNPSVEALQMAFHSENKYGLKKGSPFQEV